MLEHSATKIGDKEGDHWAISSQLSPTAGEKGEKDIYETNNRKKVENPLTARSSAGSGRKVTNASVEICPLLPLLLAGYADVLIMREFLCSLCTQSGLAWLRGPIHAWCDYRLALFREAHALDDNLRVPLVRLVHQHSITVFDDSIENPRRLLARVSWPNSSFDFDGERLEHLCAEPIQVHHVVRRA